MSVIACLIGIVVIAVLFAIIANASSSASTPTRVQEPMVMPPPVQGGGATPLRYQTPPPAPTSPMAGDAGMVIRRRRLGIPSPGDSSLVGLPTTIPDPIHIPSTIPIFRNQRTCKVCREPIQWSSRTTGWARCMRSNMLVHGHCHTFIMREHAGVRNWCTFCESSCSSGQAMRIEGRNI